MYAASVGGEPLAVRNAVTIAAPNAPPTVRMTVLIPVAIPTSLRGTASTIRFAIAENANVIPAPSRIPPTANSQGEPWKSVKITYASVISSAPSESTVRKP